MSNSPKKRKTNAAGKQTAANKKLKGDAVKVEQARVSSTAGGGIEVLNVLHTERYKSSGRKFLICTQWDDKKKKLVLDVWEVKGKLEQVIPEMRLARKITDPENMPGRDEMATVQKAWIDTFADPVLNTLKNALSAQFGAAIEMIKNAIEMWPARLWKKEKRFFYMACYTLFYLDYYLTMPPERFKPALAFVVGGRGKRPAEAVGDLKPERFYTKKELLNYLEFCRFKCESCIKNLREDSLGSRWVEEDGGRNYAFLELLLYNMRHVQHHAAQLNLMLREQLGDAPSWVGRIGP